MEKITAVISLAHQVLQGIFLIIMLVHCTRTILPILQMRTGWTWRIKFKNLILIGLKLEDLGLNPP